MMWKLWIDTGGTFTDCIALDPDGVLHRVKILSQGGLRGRILRKINPYVYEFEAPWHYNSKLLEGYRFSIQNGTEKSKLLSLNYESKTLTIEDNLPTLTGRTFELSSGEEAPVLATRLVTNTRLLHPFPAMEMRLGTTKGTNALLERKGARTLLIVTKGFKDILRIGTQQRPGLFQLHIPEPAQLTDSVWEVEERLDANGAVLKPADTESLLVKAAGSKFDSVAVALLHSYRNPAHEEAIFHSLKSHFKFISLSSELSSSAHYLRRTQTAVINAYLAPIIDRYIERIKKSLKKQDLKVMTSAGGLISSEHFLAKDCLLSGPAGGAVAASALAEQMGIEKVITFDMGGTSTDVARIDRQPELKYITEIDGVEFHNPSLAIETVAAGGGSICWFDGYTLQVGPESAGAAPGPACYGIGGPLTLTDVNILLGKLDPAKFGIPVNYEAAERALTRLKNEIFEKTGKFLSSIEILSGLELIANEKMADAIRRISVSKGIDPGQYTLVAFGGAGGLHACQLAEILDLDNVLLPFDGGLFSALGMGKARGQRIISEQILKPWDAASTEIDARICSMAERGRQALVKEGTLRTEIGFCSVFLRFSGQEHSLEVTYTKENTLDNFRTAYLNQFGYFPEQRIIELESIRVMVSEANDGVVVNTLRKSGDVPAIPSHHVQTIAFDKKKTEVPVYNWEHLHPGTTLTGPAILINAYSTGYIPLGWRGIVQENREILVIRDALAETVTLLRHTQETELELYTHRFLSIAEEMGAQLQRTAFSVNVKERLDFSCALTDPAGDLLVNAPHIPVHLGSLGICTRLVKEKISIGRGDVVITNHPAYGGSHLPDVTLIMGVFTNTGELIGYVVNRAHHAEIGGKRPGSMPPDAVTLSEEGVVILPQYLMKDGEMQWETIKKLFTEGAFPTRSYQENEADIIAALSALQKGSAQLLNLVEQHGFDQVRTYMNLLKEKAFLLLNNALLPYLDKNLKATEFLDDGHRIQVAIRFTEEEFTFDFTGTSKVHPNNLNANISILYSCILYVLRLLTDRDLPLNEGMMRKVRIVLPDDSLLHPNFDDDPSKCPAVVGGNTEVSQRLTDTLLKAFGLAACSQGTMNNLLFGDETFGYYETIGGGSGAGPDFHGRSAVHQHMTNTRITDTEELERKYPVRLWEFNIRSGSGGQGAFRGGDGIVRRFEFLRPLDITVISQHRNFSPYGCAGGNSGKSGRNTLKNSDGNKHILPGIFSAKVKEGDELIIETPGGGGFGEEHPI